MYLFLCVCIKALLKTVSSFHVYVQWLEETFLPYLDGWEQTIEAREGFTKEQKNRMLLSRETRLGLCMTSTIAHVYDFSFFSSLEFIRHLFSWPEVKDKKLSFLSNRLCQDPLQNVFGSLRQRGGTSNNPSVAEFQKNTQALRVINSFCRGPLQILP